MVRRSNIKVVFWGTYDTGKPRNRIFLRGLKENSVTVFECHRSVWGGIEDKSQISGVLTYLRLVVSWIFAYPLLIYKYFRQPAHDVVFIGYLGQFDVLILWFFAKLRGKPIVLDVFISLYDSIVYDRGLIRPYNPIAWLIYALEWLSFKAADMVLIDTDSHREYLVKTFGLDPEKTGKVLVGVEPEYFSGSEGGGVGPDQSDKFTFLFYGQFIPLHGIPTIIEAARLVERDSVEIVLIGRGQEGDLIRKMLDETPVNCIRWIPWVEYTALTRYIQSSDVCLGIFGDSAKAGRVIPNKVYQILNSGKPLLTRNSSAIRELLIADQPGVYLVPPADPKMLAAKMVELIELGRDQLNIRYHTEVREQIAPKSIGRELTEYLRKAVG